MGTRSTIALEYADGTVEQVYCHWDGYLDHNGRILAEHYTDPFKLRDLIDQGHISSLGREIGEQHPFGPAYNETDAVKKAAVQAAYDAAKEAGWTTFYARDRGETDVGAHKFKSFTDYLLNHQYEEYAYILRLDGKWYVAEEVGKFVKLTKAFEKEAA
jgi:hypothetical protein